MADGLQYRSFSSKRILRTRREPGRDAEELSEIANDLSSAVVALLPRISSKTGSSIGGFRRKKIECC